MTQKALIMIDYINDIVNPNGKIPSCAQMIDNNNIIEKCNNTLLAARKNNYLIIWIKVGFSESYAEVSNTSPIFTGARSKGALVKNTWGTELIQELNYVSGELIIWKNRINPFYSTNLELILNTNKVQEVYLAGVSTEWAVEATARDAHDKNFKITIIKDLCASSNIDAHECSIKTMQRIATIINHDELC